MVATSRQARRAERERARAAEVAGFLIQDARKRLVVLYEAWGKEAEAVRWRGKPALAPQPAP